MLGQEPKNSTTNPELQKYYKYLRDNNADVPPTYSSFENTLKDPKSAQGYYDYLKKNNFDAPETFDSFQSTFSLKKKDSTSTSTTSGKSSASGQKVGSSGTQEFELKPVFDERGRQVKIKNEKGELVPYMEKVPKGFASSTEEREIVREEQKKKALKPIIPSANLKQYKEATKITDEEKSTLQQEVEDEFNQQGIWNGMKTGMKKGFNTLANVVTTIGTFGSETEAPIQMEVDPFAKEKKQAKEELVAEKKAVTPQAITERAKQIKIQNRLDGLKVDKNNEYLSNLPEEEVKALNLEKVREYKTLGDKEKYIATKSELLKNDFDKEVKDLTVARAILEKNKKEGVVPNENLINFAIEKQESVKNKLAEAEELEKEYLASKDNIGTAEEEIDFLKRNYDTTDKVTTLAKLGLGDLWNSVSNKLPLMVSDLDEAIFEPLRPGSSEGVLSEEERQALIDKSIDWETAKELAKSGVKRDVDFDNLNVDNFGQFFAQELGTQLPIFAQMAMPGGIVSIGMTSTFDKYGRMEQESNNIAFEFDGKQFSGFEKENGEIVDSLGNTYDPNEVKITSLRTPDQSTANKFLTSVTFGTAEAVLGALPTKNIFGRALKSVENSGQRALFNSSIKQQVNNGLKVFGNNLGTEVFSEGWTQVVQNMADIASGKKDVGIFDNVDHATISAGMLSFVPSGFQAIAGIALKPFAQNKENKQVNDNLQQIFALQEQLNNTEISDVSRAAIKNKIEGLEKANGDILDGIASRTKGVSKEVFDAIKDVNKKQEILTIQATEIKNDPSLDVEVKKQLIADLESQFNQLEKKRATLVGGNATVLDALPDSESTRLKQNAAETLVKEEKAKGKADSEINFTEEQINAKAIEIYNQSNQNAVQQEATTTETKQEAQPQTEVQKTEQEVLVTPTAKNITKNETIQTEDTTTNGDIRPGIEPMAEVGGTNEQTTEDVTTESIPQAVEPTTSKRETKRVVSKTARNPKTREAAEFDVDIVDGQVVEIRKPRTGKVVPKFVEIKDKATKKVKRVQRNANWTAIADEALGQRTNNDIAKEDKATTDKAIQDFTPANEYEHALQFFATGGNVNSQSAQIETGLSNKEVKWATGFKPDSELPSVEAIAEKIVMDAEKSGVNELDMQEVRNALIDIIKSKTRDSVKQEVAESQKSRQEAKEKSEEDAYLNSLTKDEYNEYQRLKAETLIERADQEFLESMTEDEIRDYYQQKYNEQQQSEQQYYETEQQQGEQRNEEQIGSTEISSVQEIQGEPKIGSKFSIVEGFAGNEAIYKITESSNSGGSTGAILSTEEREVALEEKSSLLDEKIEKDKLSDVLDWLDGLKLDPNDLKLASDRIRSLKIDEKDNNTYISFLGIEPLLKKIGIKSYNKAIDIVAENVEKGTKLGLAIKEAINYIDNIMNGDIWDKNIFEKQIENKLFNRGKIKIYNASPKKISELGKRTGITYFATNRKEAEAYSQMNSGKIREFKVDKSDIKNEDYIFQKINDLKLKTKDGSKINDNLLYELIDDRFQNSLSKEDIETLFDELKKEGVFVFEYEDDTQVIGGRTKSIAIIDNDYIQYLKEKQIKEKFNESISFLDSLKLDRNDLNATFPFLPQSWNMFIEAVKLAVKAGKTINDAIQEAIKKLQSEGIGNDEINAIVEKFTDQAVKKAESEQEIDTSTLEDDIEVKAQGITSNRERRDLTLMGKVANLFPFKKKMKRIWNNTFRSNSGLDTKTGEVLRSLNREVAAFSDHLAHEAKEFGKIISDVSKKHKTDIDAKLYAINDYISGNKNADISFLTQEQIQTLNYYRQRIDSLSDSLISIIEDKLVDMQDRLSNLDPSKNKVAYENLSNAIDQTNDLIKTIKDNQGKYINRSYQIFSDEQYRKDITGNFDELNKEGKKRVLNAINYLIREEGLTREESTKQIAAYLADIRNKKDDYPFTPSGEAVANFLKKKKEIPQEFRELLGESKDPLYNYVNTVYKISKYIANLAYQTQLREHLITSGIGTTEAKLGYEKLSGSGQGFAILNDIYVPVEVKEAIDDMEPLKTIESGFYRTWIKLAGIVKLNKTILSPTSTARNLISGIFLGINSGHFFAKNPRAMMIAWNMAWGNKKSQTELLSERKKLIKLGILLDGSASGELMATLNDFSKETDRMVSQNTFEKAFEFFKKTYAFGDDFYKVVGFYAEKKALIDNGISEDKAEKMAAERIVMGYPTYSYLPKNIQKLRRLPLVGTFVSFPYEVWRTTKNNLMIMLEDAEAGRTKMAVERGVGFIVASAIASGLSAGSMALLGISDDDDDAIRDGLPEWQKNSKLIYIGTKDGKPQFIDATPLFAGETIFKLTNIILEKRAGRNFEDKIEIALQEFLSPYLSADLTTKTIKEILENENAFNQPIYRSDNLKDALFNLEDNQKIVNYLMKQVGPGVYNNITEFLKANEVAPQLVGEKYTNYGKEYTNQEALLALFGMRFSSINYEGSLSNFAKDIKKKEGQDKNDINRFVKTTIKLDEGDLDKSIERYQKYHDENYTKLLNMVNSAKKFGMTNPEIANALGTSGYSEKERLMIVKYGTSPLLKPISLQTAKNYLATLKMNYKGQDEKFKEIQKNFIDNATKFNKKIMKHNIEVAKKEKIQGQDVGILFDLN